MSRYGSGVDDEDDDDNDVFTDDPGMIQFQPITTISSACVNLDPRPGSTMDRVPANRDDYPLNYADANSPTDPRGNLRT